MLVLSFKNYLPQNLVNLNTEKLILCVCRCVFMHVYVCMGRVCTYTYTDVLTCVYILRTDVYMSISFSITYSHMFWERVSPLLNTEHYGHTDWEEKPWYLFWLLGSPGITDKCCFICLFIRAEDLNSALVLSPTETSLQIQMDNF